MQKVILIDDVSSVSSWTKGSAPVSLLCPKQCSDQIRQSCPRGRHCSTRRGSSPPILVQPVRVQPRLCRRQHQPRPAGVGREAQGGEDASVVHVQGVLHPQRQGHLQAGLHEGRGHRQVRGVRQQPPDRRQPRVVARPGGEEEHRGHPSRQGRAGAQGAAAGPIGARA